MGTTPVNSERSSEALTKELPPVKSKSAYQSTAKKATGKSKFVPYGPKGTVFKPKGKK